MPTPIVPQDQWETDFEGPLPGEPGVASTFRTLIQRILNRTERLKGRIGAIIGLSWDATPPDTLAGLAGRVSTLESNQGGTTLSTHRSALVLDHPDGSVTSNKLASNSVTVAKIADNAVTGTKIADNSISRTKIVDGEVTSSKLDPVRNAPTIVPSPGDWLLGGLASGTGVGKLPLGQASGVPLLNAGKALASSDAYLDRGLLSGPINWDTITAAGVYRVDASAFGSGSANMPPATYYYGVLLVLASGLTVQQIFIPNLTDEAAYFRQTWNAPYGWSQWFGAGAKYGSNSNGSYIRFADGTQICWSKQPTTQWSAATENSAVVGVVTVYYKDLHGVTFPAAFTSEPSIVIGGDINGVQLKSLVAWNPSTSNFNIKANYQLSGSSIFSYYTAIGRWR